MTRPYDDLEADVARRLRDLAATAPALDPGRRRRRPVRPALVVAAATVAVLGVGALTAVGLVAVLPDGGATSDASCAALLAYDGVRYTPVSDVHRMPVTGEELPGTGRIDGCDDGVDEAPAEDLAVRAVAGIDGTDVIVAAGDLWLRQDRALPASLDGVHTEATCEPGPAALTLTGTVTALESSLEPRFDGDVRAPYELEMQTEDPALAGAGYAWVTLQASGGPGTAPDPETVRRLLWDAGPATVELRCEAGRFAVVSLR